MIKCHNCGTQIHSNGNWWHCPSSCGWYHKNHGGMWVDSLHHFSYKEIKYDLWVTTPIFLRSYSEIKSDRKSIYKQEGIAITEDQSKRILDLLVFT